MTSKIFKRASTIFLMFCIMMSGISFATIAEGAVGTKYSIQFENMFDDYKVKNVNVYYTDSYFTNSATYNSHLSTASIGLCIAGTKEYVKGALDKFGYSSIEHKVLPDSGDDVVGLTLGLKKASNADNTYIVAVAVRCGNSDKEWISNFNLGDSGEAAGYKIPAEVAVSAVGDYVTDHADIISNGTVKYWVTGYSRRASIANLVAKRLSDESDIGKGNVFAYCFEGVKVAFPGDSKYTNIHNIVNKNDGVATVFPSYMGSGYYGTVKTIGTGYESEMKTALDNYTTNYSKLKTPSTFKWQKVTAKISPTTVLSDLDTLAGMDLPRIDLKDIDIDELISKIDLSDGIKLLGLYRNYSNLGSLYSFTTSTSKKQADFWKILEENIKKVLPSRADYYAVQDGIMDLIRLVFSVKDDETQIEAFENYFRYTDNLMKLKSIIPVGDKRDAVMKYVNAVYKKQSTLSLTDKEYELIKGVAKDIVNLLSTENLITNTQKGYADSVIDKSAKPLLNFIFNDYKSTYQIMGTLLYDGNLERLAHAHYYETNLAWLMTQDTNYNATYKKYITVSKPSIKSLKAGKKSLTVKWSKNSKATGYQVQYSRYSSFKSAKTKTITKYSTTYKKLTKLSKKKKYYVRVRAYKKYWGYTYYSSWSSRKYKKTK